MKQKLASIISAALSYPVLGLFEIIALTIIEKASYTAFLVGFVLHAFIPFAGPLVYFLKRKGDIFVSKREDRGPLFIPGLLAYMLSYYFFTIMGYRYLAILEAISFVSTLILFIVSFKWKISIHMAAMTIPLVYFTLIGFPQILFLAPLLPLLGWARMKLKAHSFSQVVAGTFVGFVSSFVTFSLI